MQRSAIPAPLPAVRMTYTNRSAMTPAAVPVRFAILSAIIRLWMIHSPEFHRVPLRQLKNPHGCLSPWINRTRCRKAKRPITDRPYIFVFYRNMKVKKGRRLVRSSVMLKRTAALFSWSLARLRRGSLVTGAVWGLRSFTALGLALPEYTEPNSKYSP